MITETQPMNTDSATHIDWAEVQGLLHSGYPYSPLASYVLVKFNTCEEDIQACLSKLAPFITYANEPTTLQRIVDRVIEGNSHCQSVDFQYEKVGVPVVNIAFTSSGLKKAGLADEDMQTFPCEFLKGMHDERASVVLGDTGENCPENWQWGNEKNSVDAVIIIFDRDCKSIDSLAEDIYTIIVGHHHDVVLTVEGALEERDAFGLTDGLSNPVIKGRQTPILRHRVDSGGPVNPGEFLCGHINERNQISGSPSVGPGLAACETLLPSTGQAMFLGNQNDDRFSFGLNGSYMVIRQLRENTEKFNTCIEKICQEDKELARDIADNVCTLCEATDFVKAKLVGRWPDGTAIIDAPTIETKRSLNSIEPKAAIRNNFGFRDHDSDGCQCPFGAHIRRAFPRDSLGDSATSSYKLINRRRLLRRGRNYYTRTESGRKLDGIMFLCLNADIGKQFEFVQGSWLNSETFAGPEPEIDPLIGVQESSTGKFSVQQKPLRKVHEGLAQFVDVLGGSYFFMPARRSIEYLIRKSQQSFLR